MIKRALLTALAVGILLPQAAQAKVYKVDPAHSSVGFTIRHFVSLVEGRFKEFTGNIDYNAANPAASSVNFTIQAQSISTDNEKRDEHLRSADFFDTAKYPTLSFVSKKVIARDKDHLDVVGEMTMHGVTKAITVPVTILGVSPGAKPGSELIGFKSEFTIDRKDFGLVYNRTLDKGGTVLGDEVTIRLLVEAGTE